MAIIDTIEFTPKNSLFVFSFLGPHVWHMEVPRLGDNPGLQLTHTQQSQWIWATSVNYTAACSSTTRSLTRRARAGIKPTSSQTLCQVLNPLTHKKNSLIYLIIGSLYSFTTFIQFQSLAPTPTPSSDNYKSDLFLCAFVCLFLMHSWPKTLCYFLLDNIGIPYFYIFKNDHHRM